MKIRIVPLVRFARWLQPAFLALLLVSAAAGQSNDQGSRPKQPDIIPQGSSLPGWGTRSTNLDGPGYLEFGGSRSDLSDGNPSWTDFYLRGAASSGRNTFTGEANRQQRFGELGYFYSLGYTRAITEDWYGQVSAGTSSTGGRFLPKWTFDAVINRKLLSDRRLVLSGGWGYDKSKLVNTDQRFQGGAMYFFQRFPVIVQAGVTFTKAQPGDILAPAEYFVGTWGREKEHYFTVRGEIGREAYEIVGPNTIFDFPIHNYAAQYRQWIGMNWGFNLTYEHDGNPFYRRNGASVAMFIDF